MSAFPKSLPSCFHLETLLSSADFCRLPAEVNDAIAEAWEQICASDDLRRLLWHGHWQLLADRFHQEFASWPDDLLDDGSGMFFLVLALSLVPPIRRRYAELGIEEDIIRDSCLQIQCFYNNHKAFHEGAPGIERSQIHWLVQYADARLFRLGRFEYRLKKLDRFGIALRHRRTGEFLLLAPPGSYTDAGYRPAPPEADAPLWHASVDVDETTIAGAPVSPEGHALRDRRRLSRHEWEIVLQPGDWFLDLHIPSGGGMTPEACHASFRQAFEFFETRFPETPAASVVCWSWIFNPAWTTRMPGGNLAKLISNIYAFPADSSGTDGMAFVFGQGWENRRAQLPRKTSLQKALLEILESGAPLRSGGMFLHRDMLRDFGR